ncbi:hypothetical protein Hanom_Chr03g00206661 [Helianthus anomalus]
MGGSGSAGDEMGGGGWFETKRGAGDEKGVGVGRPLNREQGVLEGLQRGIGYDEIWWWVMV